MSFIPLQIRTGYSFYESTVQINPLVDRAKQLEYDILALTDEGVLYAAIPFYKACIAKGIKPIIGLTMSIEIDGENIESIVLAKSTAGYKELLRISTELQTGNETKLSNLFTKTKELIFIIQCHTPIVYSALLNEEYEQLESLIKYCHSVFGREHVFLGIDSSDLVQTSLITHAKAYSKQEFVSFVGLHDVRYVKENEVYSYDCLQAMKRGIKWTPTQLNEQSKNRHLPSKSEIEAQFSQWPELIEASLDIAEQCNIELTFDEVRIPKFPLRENEQKSTYLFNLCKQNLQKKYPHNVQRATERLHKELKIIKQLQFEDYFLIVADFVQYAREEGIAVGHGRGSAAGSIVAYLLGITKVDPLKYNLLFERFLNPERVTYPDIDIDFSDRHRDRVIQYIEDKYGSDYVAQIITFGTFGARSILRELMKTMDINENDQRYILSHIPVNSNLSILDHISAEKEFKKYVKQSRKLTTLLTIAIQLEGLPRHISTHAAGIIIGEKPLMEDVPLTQGTGNLQITQYAMDELEAIGLLKIDILGLRNLTLIERIVQSIRHHEQADFTLENINKNDKKTFTLLQKGLTNGVFQLESAGMKKNLRRLKPTSEADIIALNALYRPGPMEFIPTYIRRKHGKEKTSFLHPHLEPILGETYGVLVYQEQIMQIASTFATFTMGEADLLRRAISDKDEHQMTKLRKRFIDGCLQNGYSKHVAVELFNWIVTFANYGFNKSHSVAYSKITYELAYLKANYPVHFFAELLSLTGHSSKKRLTYVQEAKSFGIRLLAPSVNHSKASFAVEQKSIRVGLLAIKGVGYDSVEKIIKARQEGKFKHLFDFCLRVTLRRPIIETLILAGAFDETYPNRASLLASVTPAMERAELFGSYEVSTLFKDELDMKPAYINIEDFSQRQKLKDEKDLLQVYVSAHPLEQYRSLLTRQQFVTVAAAKQHAVRSIVKTIAYVDEIKKIRTRRGESMAFLTLGDETGELEAVMFPKLYRRVTTQLKEEELVIVRGEISERNNEKQLILLTFKKTSIDLLEQNNPGELFIKIQSEDKRFETLQFLSELVDTYPGKTKIIIYDETTKKAYRLSEKYALFCNSTCFKKLRTKFGFKNVVFRR